MVLSTRAPVSSDPGHHGWNPDGSDSWRGASRLEHESSFFKFGVTHRRGIVVIWNVYLLYGRLCAFARRTRKSWAPRQLNLVKHGHLATTQLGRAVFWDTLKAALMSSSCNFVGALFPLTIGAFLPSPPWISLIVALVALGALGIGISQTVYGEWLRWSLALMIAGGAVTFIGTKLHIT